MPEVAVLIKVPIADEDLASLREYRAKNVKALKRSPGFEALSIWENQAAKGQFLILVGYESDEAAEKGLKVSLGAGPLVAALKTVAAPPTVRRSTIEFQHGKRPSDIIGDSYLSLSIRVAGPGMGSELLAELKRIFSELALIDGYLGSFGCRNVALDEEIAGVALWSNREAFESSLPSTEVYEVELYRRTV